MEKKPNLRIQDLVDPKKAAEHYPQLEEYFQKGGTWANLMGLTVEVLEGHYAFGYEHYQAGRFEEAQAAFATLTVLNPYVAKYWLALGASREFAGDHVEAIAAYKLARAMDETWALPPLYLARCHLEMNEGRDAEDLLDEFDRLAYGQPGLDEGRHEAAAIRHELRNR